MLSTQTFPLRKILCPVDFSEASLKSLNWAAELALRFNAELCVLNVVSFSPPVPPEAGFVASELVCLDQERLKDAQRQLQDVVSRLDPQVKAHPQALMGQDAYEIVHVAEKGTDLIVLSTHGRSGWKRLCCGSVTEKVLHHAPCPVLAIRHVPDEQRDGILHLPKPNLLPLRTLLCPVDYSEASLDALDIASKWAQQFEAQLDVLHVVPTISEELAPGDYASPEYNRIWLAADRAKLCELVNTHVPKEVRSQPVVRLGNAAEGIERAAHDGGADLIVLSTHGYSGWKHLVFGSVAEQVLRGATIPLLIIRAAHK